MDINITDLCEHVIQGGALPNYCKLKNIKYSQVIKWLYADEDREQEYELALKARGEWFIQSILDELKTIALADIRDAYDESGNLLPVHQWPDHVAKIVQAVEVQEDFEGQGVMRKKVGETKRLKLWDKLKSIELLGKNLKLFKDQVEHTGQLSLEELVQASIDNPIPVMKLAPQVDAVEALPAPEEIKE